MVATAFAAVVLATTAAHCDVAPPPPPDPTATFELLNGPVVTAGDTLRFRAGINNLVAPESWTVYFTGPGDLSFVNWYEGFPAGECGALNGTAIPNTDATVDFSAEVECVLPSYVENGTWRMSVMFRNGTSERVGPAFAFNVTGGSDHRSGPTVQFTEFPMQPVVAGQSFEVAARITDPNGIALADGSLAFAYGPGPRPQCVRLTTMPHPTFDIEVRYRCDTTAGSAGTYEATLTAFDLQWRSGESPTQTVTII